MAMKPSGRDAAEMKPALIPDDELRGRDNSGGLDYEPYTMEFGDGGHITGGPKPHLAPSGTAGNDAGDYDMSERRKGERGPRKGGG